MSTEQIAEDNYNKTVKAAEKAAMIMFSALKQYIPELYEKIKDKSVDAYNKLTEQEAREALHNAKHEAFIAACNISDRVDSDTMSSVNKLIDKCGEFNSEWKLNLVTLNALAERMKDMRKIEIVPGQMLNPDLIKSVTSAREFARANGNLIEKAHLLHAVNSAATKPLDMGIKKSAPAIDTDLMRG